MDGYQRKTQVFFAVGSTVQVHNNTGMYRSNERVKLVRMTSVEQANRPIYLY